MRGLVIMSSCIIFPNGVAVYAVSAALHSNMVFLRNERGMSVADVELDVVGVTADELFSAMTDAGFHVEDKRG